MHAAQQLFAPVSDGYLLSEESLPHITVCQFDSKDEEEALSLWNQLEKYALQPCPIRLTGVSFVKGVGEHQGVYWAELSVARSSELMKIHRVAVELFQSNGYELINDIHDLYRPHLTLARIHKPKQFLSWPDETLSNEHGPFVLALGLGDQNGQFKKMLAVMQEK
ncbi:MAG: 2'-5' RNA ligase family protein [Simkaniaceae bacterium]|nr:2'-5' RNA ligase family protein [Simkaniaceae bacterium]